ncbi:hypothetical protein [Lactobacillus helveticus]|uniref:GGDEF domain-containing protein n=2 Tax=Lactobacillus helveticus TaxID=1587 RepID=A0A3Q8SW86_LACHE|nr:hypothetical protein [Lactobacillus helveticus]AFR21161.1 hypothetical protein R0052_00635 [Lactobacillus helveticus R0052]AZK91865.1 hypothetical protein LH5_01634 [Lactobacillus helveticus]MCJ2190816.1 FUSC family protein [Lactobacillus helveticus]MED7628823.1 hypothetical protein [Lactobacillus helveticus]MZR06402.1 hypothetical protein [Lactobacillus helveticus]
MTKKYIRLIYLTLIAALVFPVIVLWIAESFSPNVDNGLMMIFLLAIFVGLFSARYTISWLIIILTTIAAGFLLLGYVVMPASEKIALIMVFPIEATLLSILRHHILEWRVISAREEDVRRHVAHYNLNVKLQTYYNANKFYQRELKQIKNYADLNLWTYVGLIRWEHYKQLSEYYPNEYLRILRQIAKALKTSRLKSEFIYYVEGGTFMVISPQITREMMERINTITEENLCKMSIPIPIDLKMSMQKIDLKNYQEFPELDKLVKHLHRGLETDIIVEYLKEDQDD